MEEKRLCEEEETKKTQQKQKNPDPTLWKCTRHTNHKMEGLKKSIEKKYKVSFKSYWDFHQWSVDNSPAFWEEVWHDVGIICSRTYDQACLRTGPGVLDCKWFHGALLNYAENILRVRNNNDAIIYKSIDGCVEKMTYAEFYDSVQLYAAAFKKHGLKKSDIVACQMSNRTEAMIALFATVSIGAIWTAIHPFYGAQHASNIYKRVDPKFLIVVDRFLSPDKEMNLLQNLPIIAQNVPSLQKIIVVPTRKGSTDISHIPKCCLLDSFLSNGRSTSGKVPELVFEQVPFDHPLWINFTSGTTGIAKAPVHSHGFILSDTLMNYIFYGHRSENAKGQDNYNDCPPGWTIWNYYLRHFSSGRALVNEEIFHPIHKDGTNLWDLLSEHKVDNYFLVSGTLELLAKENARPGPKSSLDHLKTIGLGGSTPPLWTLEYLRSVLPKNTFVFNAYGDTEIIGQYASYDFDLPTYPPEVQVPMLGKDIRCVDENGRPVIGQRGEIVLCNSGPFYPIYLWNDENNEVLHKSYLSKYPGCWSINDEGYINPKTKGLYVLGRIDDVMTQAGDRYSASDVYLAISDIKELVDYACIEQKHPIRTETRTVLFVKLREGCELNSELRSKIEDKIEDNIGPSCIPNFILEVLDIPYNVNNKRVESLIRKIVHTNEIPAMVNIRNPECLKCYINIPELMNF